MEILIQSEEVEKLAEENRNSYANHWQLIPLDGLSPKAKDQVHRLNGLGQLYYFVKVVLQKHRLTEDLHKTHLCDILETEHLKEVIEFPRDHFKSTVCSEGAPMWWALPFSSKDEQIMSSLGYSDEFIKWMKRSHNPDTRTLLASENVENAAKLGARIDYHYKDNEFFKKLYPEIQLDTACKWTVESKTHKRTKKISAGQGEGTYDYLGAGGALQSRHYDRVIQDDLFGKKALESDLVMQGIIDWHRLLVGAFDSQPDEPDWDNDEIIVGNRWGYRDLNYWIRQNEPYFNIHNHSALGGCCPAHPAGQFIFPQEFGEKKLGWWKARLGPYFFSCQFLNRPTPPGETFFKTSTLKYFSFKTVETDVPIKPDYVDLHYSGGVSHGLQQSHRTILTDERETVKRVAIQHDVQGGLVMKDILPNQLERYMVCDPNHSGEEGRSRHAAMITGLRGSPISVYLLEAWARACGHGEYIDNIFRLAEKWKMKKVHFETVGAQTWAKFHIETQMRIRKSLGKWTFTVEPLKTSRAKEAKTHRINSLSGVFERGEFWMLRSGQENFKEEYEEYPHFPTRDLLDVLGYSAEIWSTNMLNDKDFNQIIHTRQQNFKYRSRNTATGY